MTELCDDGYEVMIETSGSRDISGVDDRVKVVMDLKAPGSGMAENNKYENIQHLGSDDEVKFVILDRADFEWSLETIDEWNLTDVCDVIFSPVHDELEPGTLANWLLDAHQAGIRIGLQIHKYLGME
jgi:7-carboxy-7-deazaguanine synthase